MSKTFIAIALMTVAAAVAVGGCGDDSGSGGAYGGKGGTTTEASSGSAPEAGGSTVVSVADNPELGSIVVDAEGFTLYDFHKDRGEKSACYGACAGTWPPLATDGPPKTENGAKASLLGTTERSDGTVQVTYAGHPLYTYAADTEPGDAKGNDIDQFGAEWYALQPNGEEPAD